MWLRADSAFSCRELVQDCRQQGYDYSLSVTDACQKAPLLRIVEQLQLAEGGREPLDAEGQERTTMVYYRPTGWADEEGYEGVAAAPGWG